MAQDDGIYPTLRSPGQMAQQPPGQPTIRAMLRPRDQDPADPRIPVNAQPGGPVQAIRAWDPPVPPRGSVPLPVGVTPSTAGAGRGGPSSVTFSNPAATPVPPINPAGAANAMDVRLEADAAARPFASMGAGPAPAPFLPGQRSSVAVPGAAGVQRITTADGGTLYSNMAGDNSDLYQGGRVSAIAGNTSAQNIATMERAGATYREIAAMNAGTSPAASVMPDRQAEAEALREEAYWRSKAGRGSSQRAKVYAAMADALASKRVGSADRVAADAAATERTRIQDAGATARQASQNATSIATTGMQQAGMGPLRAAQTAEASARATDSAVQAQGRVSLLAAQEKYRQAVVSGNPDAVERAVEELRAVQGKWEKAAPASKFQAVAVPGGVDPATGRATGSSVVIYDTSTGQPATHMSPGQVRGDANKAPHAEGTRLRGPDGKTYVVKNGAPVLEAAR